MRMTSEPHTKMRSRPECIAQSECAAGGAGNRRWHGMWSITLVGSAVVLGGILHVSPSEAFEFGNGEFEGSLDTTVSHGMTYRVEKRNDELTADANGNDGNLNYDRGVVSNVSKFVTDLDISQDNYGLFVRTTGFLDFENDNGERARTALSDEAKELVGSNIEVLDAYVTAGYNYGDAAIDFRLGKHVLNWGESTFIPNGINAINPFDVSKLRLPGSELREALLPVGMASVTVEPNDTLSVTGFWQYDWEETRIDPVGSYFSSTDYVGPGANKAVITTIMEGLRPGQPTLWDQGYGFGPLTPAINADLTAYTITHPQSGAPIPYPLPNQPTHDENFASVPRGPDRTPEDGDQYGLAVRYFAEDLNDTEFGFYFINYHSRLPTVAARAPSRKVIQDALGAASAVTGDGSATVAALTAHIQPQVVANAQRAVAAGLITQDQLPGFIAMQVGEQVFGQVSGIASSLAIDRYSSAGRYFLDYPEDLQLFGLSFNTVLGTSGWALQGEYSLRPDAPLQRAERSVITDGLAPIGIALALSQSPERLSGYLENYQPFDVPGYVERDVSQLQATATRLFGPTMGANALVFVAEAAVMHVHDMPDKQSEPLESPAGGMLATSDADADATSWGYRIAARLDYYNAIGAINLYPYVQFLHDVSGNSPAPSGPFVEGRTAITLGLKADYLSRWQANFGYTQYAGDGNELSDRDFISASIKYSF